jgi:hypothetical protein
MERIRTVFFWLAVTGPLHMIEQLLFGIQELDEMKQVFGLYYSWFANPDVATVVLVTIIGASVLFMVYGLIAGTGSRLAVLSILGLFSIGEGHHLLRVLASGAYNPGVVTSLPFAVLGALLVSAVWREYQETRQSATPSMAQLSLR